MRHLRLLALAAVLAPAPVLAQAEDSVDTPRRAAQRDPMQEGLPLVPDRRLAFTTRVGHWMSVDVSPDGATLVVDLLGDLYTLPAAGGRATALTRGMAFDAQPRFSPDGKRVLFVSDRDGGWNLWSMALDKSDTVQITRGKTNNYFSPEYTPDGNYVVASRGTKLWMYHRSGGSGQQLVRPERPAAGAAPAPGGGGGEENVRQLGAAVSRDGRWVWYAQRQGNSGYNTPMGDWGLYAYDRESGRAAERAERWGSAFRPTLSPDGRWLVYATRHVDSTRLRVRDLESGAERWLVRQVQRDDIESSGALDLYPGMSFTPDSKFLVATWGGRLWRTPVAGGASQEIPFEAEVVQAVGPAVKFEYAVPDTGMLTVKQVRDAVPSPDGTRLAFVAMDRLYVMPLPRPGVAPAAPRRLTRSAVGEFEPTWSPDGRWIAYTTWSDSSGGQLYKARADGSGAAVRLTRAPGYYAEPAWSPDGRRIAVMRSAVRSFDETLERGLGPADDVVWVPADGGDARLIAPGGGLANPHFTRDTARVYLYGTGRLVSMRWDGTDLTGHLRVNGPRPQGADDGDGPGAGRGNPATLVMMAPTGDRALAQISSDLYVVDVPRVGGTEPAITVGGAPDATSFPARRLTDIGGQFPAWSRDGRRVHWSIGNAHAVYDLERAAAFDDSVRRARRAGRGGGPDDPARQLPAAPDLPRPDSAAPDPAPPDPAPTDSVRPVPTPGDPARPDPTRSTPAAADSTRPALSAFRPFEFRVRMTAPRDMPRGVAVLRGARVVTMRGDEIIDNADVVIRDSRIAAVGRRGSVAVPAGARVIDVAGKTIVPGFVDTHAHLRPAYELHRGQVWSYAANLAYGVTTARDPQTFTTDMLAYEDLVAAGEVLGPRIYSTGPGIFGANSPQGQNIRNLEQARSVVRRYSEYYDTKTVKQYGTGNREQRQWIIQAAREQRIMPTLEGGLDYKKNVTEIIDSYSGLEHTLPTFPTQPDVLRLMAFSGIVYTPTLLVAYGGPWAEDYYYATEDVFGDAKLRRFTPWAELERKALRRGGNRQAGWFHPSQHVFRKIGEQVRDLVALGGKVGVGSHGQLQGLGYHWELWSMASGGLPTHAALRAATLGGAEAIGLGRDLGSVEPGKLADLLVLDRDPLQNIRNSNSIRLVIKNGRVYDAATLDETWPRARKAPTFYWNAGEQ